MLIDLAHHMSNPVQFPTRLLSVQSKPPAPLAATPGLSTWFSRIYSSSKRGLRSGSSLTAGPFLLKRSSLPRMRGTPMARVKSRSSPIMTNAKIHCNAMVLVNSWLTASAGKCQRSAHSWHSAGERVSTIGLDCVYEGETGENLHAVRIVNSIPIAQS